MLIETIETVFKDISDLVVPADINKLVLDRLSKQEEHEDRPDVLYRASSIGKPWIIQVLNKWYGKGNPPVYMSQATVMFEGRVAQAWAETVLSLCKLQFTTEGEVRFGPVLGHYDILVTKRDKRAVLEVKSMAGHVLTAFKNAPHDDYGYLSQLSFYATVLNVDDAAFLLFDRSQGKWHVVPITKSAISTKFTRLERALEALADLKPYDVQALVELEMIPLPINGNIPSSMKRSRWSDYLYTYREGEYHVQDKDTLARLLGSIPAERGDGVQLRIPGL